MPGKFIGPPHFDLLLFERFSTLLLLKSVLLSRLLFEQALHAEHLRFARKVVLHSLSLPVQQALLLLALLHLGHLVLLLLLRPDKRPPLLDLVLRLQSVFHLFKLLTAHDFCTGPGGHRFADYALLSDRL